MAESAIGSCKVDVKIKILVKHLRRTPSAKESRDELLRPMEPKAYAIAAPYEIGLPVARSVLFKVRNYPKKTQIRLS